MLLLCVGDAAFGDSFCFPANASDELHLEFFLQVTPEDIYGWIQRVPTVLKGKYRQASR